MTTNAYDLGVVDGMTKVARGEFVRPLLRLRHPEVWGAFSGAAMGALVADEGERMGSAMQGAVIGGALGHMKRKAKLIRWSSRGPGVGGPTSPVAVPGGVHALV